MKNQAPTAQVPGYIRDATAAEVMRSPGSTVTTSGFRVVVVDAFAYPDSGWRPVPQEQSLPCRMRVGDSYCRREAVALLKRGVWANGAPNLWAYCGEHLYGRKLVDGRLEEARLIRL